MTARTTSLVGTAFVAGLMQLIGVTALGLAQLEHLRAAEAQGSWPYLLLGLAAAAAAGLGWWFRGNHLAAVAAGLAPLLIAGWFVRGALSDGAFWLGLAFYGWFILHNFLTLLCAAVCLVLAVRWATRFEGWRRWVPTLLIALTVVDLLAVHLWHLHNRDSPGARVGQAIGTALALVTVAVALAAAWKSAHIKRPGQFSALMLALLVVRVAFAGIDGLHGAPVGTEPFSWPDIDGLGPSFILGALILASSLAVFVGFRPPSHPLQKALLLLLSFLLTWQAYHVYQQFGEIEDGIAGPARALLGFTIPYPAYVANWKVMGMMVGIFFIVQSVLDGLLSWPARPYAFALGLMTVAGLGLTSPQHVLMVAAALLTLVEMMIDPPDQPTSHSAPSEPLELVLAEVAEALELPDPVLAGEVIVLRTDDGDQRLEIRARRQGRHWSLAIHIGLLGRSEPEAALVPDRSARAPRPEHPIAATHRLQGSVRTLEGLGEEKLDAMIEFPHASLELWPAGTRIDFGGALAEITAARLVAIIRLFRP